MDHVYSSKSVHESMDEIPNDTENGINDLKIDEKVGDGYLIELYREKRFLYDKQDKNLKDNQMKWMEVSKIMIEKNCGAYYTADYCQKRIKTLREKFARLQRNELNSKSSSAASGEKKSPLLNQLSFLNSYIHRRKTYSNIKVDNLKENNTCSNIKVEKVDNLKENNITLGKIEKIITSENKREENKGETKESKFAKKKIEEEKVLNIISDLTHNILAECPQSSNMRSPETAFAEYIALELNRLTEPERSIKKQKLIEILFAPL